MLSPRMTRERAAAAEAPRQAQRLGDAAGLVLHAVGELAAVVLAAAEQLDEVAHVLGAGDEQDLPDARPRPAS